MGQLDTSDKDFESKLKLIKDLHIPIKTKCTISVCDGYWFMIEVENDTINFYAADPYLCGDYGFLTEPDDLIKEEFVKNFLYIMKCLRRHMLKRIEEYNLLSEHIEEIKKVHTKLNLFIKEHNI